MTISISVIIVARKIISFLSYTFWVNKFKETKIVDLVGQGRLTTMLTISISVNKGARKMIIICFPRIVYAYVQ